MFPGTPFELKISRWQIAFSVVGIVIVFIVFMVWPLWDAWHSPRRFDTYFVVTTVFVGSGMAWLLHGGARRVWFETGLYLRVDENEISVRSRRGNRTLRWEEIYDITTDDKSVDGQGGYWISLRGREDEVLAQWDRSWTCFTPHQMQRGKDIEAFVEERLRMLGRLVEHVSAATCVWQQLHPLDHPVVLEVQTNYAGLGWVFIIVFLPCSLVFWKQSTFGQLGAPLFLCFVVLGIYVVSAKSVLRVDEEQIQVTSFYGRSRMEWREVTKIEIDEQGHSLSIEGGNKRLRFSGPNYWKSEGRRELLLFLAATCEKRGLDFNRRVKPSLGLSKNTRVWR